jgi:hypothetical protein
MPWRKYPAEISCEDFPSTFCPWIVHSGEKETPDCNGRGGIGGNQAISCLNMSGGSARESNPPTPLVTRHNGFEVVRQA